jgi:hypothetical protein
MFVFPLILSCACCWSSNDFKNEIDMQVYQISQEIEKVEISDSDLYNLGYLNGRLDVYKSLQDVMNQKSPN